jgi:hypothetical protein
MCRDSSRFTFASPLAQPREEVTRDERVVVDLVARFREHALDDHVVRHRGARLRRRRRVVEQRVHRARQLVVEERAVRRRVNALEVGR